MTNVPFVISPLSARSYGLELYLPYPISFLAFSFLYLDLFCFLSPVWLSVLSYFGFGLLVINQLSGTLV